MGASLTQRGAFTSRPIRVGPPRFGPSDTLDLNRRIHRSPEPNVLKLNSDLLATVVQNGPFQLPSILY